MGAENDGGSRLLEEAQKAARAVLEGHREPTLLERRDAYRLLMEVRQQHPTDPDDLRQLHAALAPLSALWLRRWREGDRDELTEQEIEHATRTLEAVGMDLSKRRGIRC